MRILFAGTPEFAVAPLQALLKEHNVVGVFTQPDRKSGRGKKLTPPPIKVLAQEHSIPVYQPNNLQDSLQDQAIIINALNIDVIVVVAYGMLLPQNILGIPRLGCINIHASILPRWRGAAPIQRAIEAGDKKTGVSIMRMESGLDTGPVYCVLSTLIDTSDTSESLHHRLSVLGAQGITGILKELETNPSIQPAKQNNNQACYAQKITKQEAIIDWTMSAVKIDQQIRAFIPWPICQTTHNDARIRVWQSSPVSSTSGKPPGEIITLSHDGADVACGTGTLRLEKLQRDGGKPLQIQEFCNGYSLKAGDQLGTN